MRVIAGKYRSRPLKSMRGMEVRPTADRLRETLFNVLCAGNPETLVGKMFVDLFAGTGAVGIEAISRGAARVVFVESSAKAAGLIEENLGSLGIRGGFEIVRGDAVATVENWGAREAADVVFLDPPYAMETAYGLVLGALAESGMVGEGTLVIAEHDKRFDPGVSSGGLRRVRVLKQGDARLSVYRRQ
jgi:16S rRNA (guanine(966)-N(2))-methyltransferase RsmD